MHRRTFGRLAAGTVLAGAYSPLAARAGATDGVRFSIMLWTLAKLGSFDQSIEMAALAGYQGVELVGEFQRWSPGERARVMAKMLSLGLVFDAMSGVKAGFSVPGDLELFRTQFTQHLRSAQEFECSKVILLSGNRVDGLATSAQRLTSIDNLKWAAERAAKINVDIVIEPIDLLENPMVYLSTVTDAFAITRAVASPNVQVLYDFYHEQRSYGNLIEKLQKNIDLVGLVHVADVPGRHDPASGEIDYQSIYRSLAQLGYKHWIAMEYYPIGDSVTSLRKARLDVERAFGR